MLARGYSGALFIPEYTSSLADAIAFGMLRKRHSQFARWLSRQCADLRLQEAFDLIDQLIEQADKAPK
jgi:hypothetical protein